MAGGSLFGSFKSQLYRAIRVSLLLAILISFVSFVDAHGGDSNWEVLKHFAGPIETTSELWAYSLTSTVLISAAPFFILFFIPLRNTSEHSTLLKVLLSFASGGLLGDAFLHLIPHAISPHHAHHHDHHHEEEVETHDGHTHLHDHDHEHDHEHDFDHDHNHDHVHDHDHMTDMIVGLWVLAGIVTFLMVEKFVRLAKGGHGHGHNHASLELSDEHNHVHKRDEATVVKGENENLRSVKKRAKGRKVEAKMAASNIDSNHPTSGEIKVAGYLNLAADFTHNFTDGLAIGASYLAGRSVGIITTFTILIHEVPHEIGDFAILIQSGCPKRKAMFLQLLTAVGAIGGTICGLLVEGGETAATGWVLPFTAGGFIYIATVSVIPELLGDTSLKQSVMEILAILVGIGLMVAIAYYE